MPNIKELNLTSVIAHGYTPVAYKVGDHIILSIRYRKNGEEAFNEKIPKPIKVYPPTFIERLMGITYERKVAKVFNKKIRSWCRKENLKLIKMKLSVEALNFSSLLEE